MARAQRFWSGLFGWQLQGPPGVYLSVPAGDGIPGGVLPVPAGATYATFAVQVADVDAAAARAVELGAVVVVPPADNPGGVRSAYLRDPDGSVFAVWRPPAGGVPAAG
nr:VOC family protein [Kineococcus siccus]